MLDFNYNWFIIGGAALLLIIIFWLPVRLLFTNPPNED
jgi:membrane-anchored glycerophosphoryl diester phosphodiesterase (GDPDase)